jgi:hypothetical protein
MLGERVPGKEPAHPVATEDRGQEANPVAPEVVEQGPVPGVHADDPDPAVVVAHEAVPLEVVGQARRAARLGERRTASSISVSSAPGNGMSGS